MKLFILFALLGCAFAAPRQGERTVIDVLADQEQTTILEWIELAGLTEALGGEGPFTVFAPKQEVLDNLPADLVEAITSDLDLLTKGLTYHVATGSFMSSDLADEALLPTVQGTNLRVNLYDVDGQTVATVAGVPIDLNMVDIDAGNGVVHMLDFIILDVPDFDTVGTLQNVDADTGVSFDALLYAGESLGLTDQAGEADGYTLLAPIDSEGFSTEIVDELLADPDALTAILLDHVIDRTLYSVGLELGASYTTLGGNTLTVLFDETNGYFVADADGNLLADIIAGDVSTTQGVIHVLDRPIIIA